MTEGQAYRERVPRRSVSHRVRDVEYTVHEWGNNTHRLLFLLHGWGDSGATFQFFVDALEQDWFVVAPDWRGFGDSGKNAGAYWFPDYLADLDTLLRLYSPQAPVALLGHSMGANAAALYAGIVPERVAALINVEGFGLDDSDADGAPFHYRRWIEAARKRREHPGYAVCDELVEKILRRSPRMSAAQAQFVARHWADDAENGRLRLKMDAAHRWPNAIPYRRAEAEACWRRIRAPVLLLTGEDSACRGNAATWREAAGRPLADAIHIGIPGAGHMLHFEQPARLAAAVEGFLSAVPATAAPL